MSSLLHILSLGAGVQSSTLALMAAAGEFGPNAVDHAIFADTQAEPASVMVWLDQLERFIQAAPYPFPVHRVTQGHLGEDGLKLRVSKRSGKTYQKNLIPLFVKNPDGTVGLLGRKCTATYKVDVILRKVKELAGVGRGCRSVKAIQWIGISRDESHRMKESRVSWVRNTWPLIDRGMSRSNCLEWLQSHGYPYAPRSACVFCPYHSNAEWARLQVDEPEAFAVAVEWERQAQVVSAQDEVIRGQVFCHRSLRPLAEIDFMAEIVVGGREQPNLFGAECEGMCGV